jgi:hypothetical protein
VSLLTLVQKVADRVGITRPTAVVSSTDTQVRQLYALANEEGMELSRRHEWQALTTEQVFVTVAQAEQTNMPIPDDLGRFVPNSFFDRTTRRRLIGPITPQEWQAIQAFPAFNRVYLAFRERDGAFLITPDPPAGEEIAYEYVSTNWARSSTDQPRSEFTADEDTAALDEELMAQGLRWRWKQAKGLDYGEDMQTYERNVARAIAADGGMTAISMGTPSVSPVLLANIPDGNFGL